MQTTNHRLTIMGVVDTVGTTNAQFTVKCRDGSLIDVTVEAETQVRHLRNLDRVDRDRVATPPHYNDADPYQHMRKYIIPKRLVVVEGIRQVSGKQERFGARVIHLLHNTGGQCIFEERHFWLTQIRELADVWLSYIFGENQQFDFGRYSTNIDISGIPTDEGSQECATLSRLIYGLSSAYLLTGINRFLDAAKDGVDYQRRHFSSPTDDAAGLLWAFARMKRSEEEDPGVRRRERVMTSRNPDDYDTIPLYEQIYAIAGLTQYYRITLDSEVLNDIRRTVYTFNHFYHDPPIVDGDYRTDGNGYYSHADYPKMDCDVEKLAHNRARKNWNSIGDHIPAYLINLILALEPLPTPLDTDDEFKAFLNVCKGMLSETSQLIASKFPDPQGKSPFVRERFFRDWTPDTNWRWQKDRAIVGHNLKIAWNLTRVAFYYKNHGDNTRAAALFGVAEKLGLDMERFGLDSLRGGVYDVIERSSPANMPSFPWWTSKDFWQQEQGILAYLILHGYARQHGNANAAIFLDLARELMAFWNIFFLDHDEGGIYFRVSENGEPYLTGAYRVRGAHSISGYHAFELNYLAHIYICAFVGSPGQTISINFRPALNTPLRAINVLPDFLPQERVELVRITVNGRSKNKSNIDAKNFQVQLENADLGQELVAEFKTL